MSHCWLLSFNYTSPLITPKTVFCKAPATNNTTPQKVSLDAAAKGVGGLKECTMGGCPKVHFWVGGELCLLGGAGVHPGERVLASLAAAGLQKFLRFTSPKHIINSPSFPSRGKALTYILRSSIPSRPYLKFPFYCSPLIVREKKFQKVFFPRCFLKRSRLCPFLNGFYRLERERCGVDAPHFKKV